MASRWLLTCWKWLLATSKYQNMDYGLLQLLFLTMFFSFPLSFCFLACIKCNINRQHGGQLGMVYLATMLKLF